MRAKPAFPILRRRHYLGRHLRHGWTLHEGSGKASDVADPLASGTLTGAGVTWKASQQGWAVNQTATAAHYIAMPSLPVSRIIPAQFTVIFAYNPGASGDRPVFGFLGSGTSNVANSLAIYDGGWNIANGSSFQLLTAPPLATANAINIYAITDDGVNYTTYKDGVQQTQNAITVNPASGSNRQFCIGGSGLSGAFEDNHAGKMSWFYIFDRALSLAELKSVAADPFQMFVPALGDRIFSSFASAPIAPSAPTLTATAHNYFWKIDLSWPDLSNEDRYYVERSLNGVDFTQIAELNANVTSYEDGELPANSTFYYRVRASNAAGFGSYSSIVSATTISVDAASALTGLEGAYSMRRVRAAYAGNCLRLRRDSDSAESDFGFDDYGDLDAAAISTWLGGANGFLVTWYDQSGNTRNATQSTAANQPAYVASGINGKPTLDFNGSTQYLEVDGLATPLTGTSPIYTSIVARVTLAGTFQYAFTLSRSTTATDFYVVGVSSGNTYRFGRGSGNNGHHALSSGSDYIFSTTFYTNGFIAGFVNGANEGQVSSGGTQTFDRGTIGAHRPSTGTAQYFDGYISEAVVYSSSPTTRERRDVIRYQARYWQAFTWDNTLETDNAADHLDIPVYSGADFQAIHPDVYDSGEGLTTDGHRFWMVHTPYPGSDATKENPSIVVSDAAPGVSQVWSEPVGITNPIAGPPGAGNYGDPDLILAQDGNWYVYYFWNTTTDEIRIISSSDGVTWGSDAQLFTLSSEGSPCVVWDGSQYVMYTFNTGATRSLRRRTSSNPDSGWSSSTTISMPTIEGRQVWDFNVTYDLATGIFHGFFAYAINDQGAATEMYYGTSTDGIDWTVHQPALLCRAPASTWDNLQIYRGSAIKKPGGFDFWYSAKSSDWHTGYTEITDVEAVPAAPSALSATATGDTTIDLAWTDNSADETGFSIERSTDGVNFSEIDTAAANATTYNDTGLTAGTLYYYRVRAFNNQGYSGYSNIDSATTTGGGNGGATTRSNDWLLLRVVMGR